MADPSPTKQATPPWTIANDKPTTTYVDKILGVKGGGVADVAGSHTDATLEAAVKDLRSYHTQYGLCKEKELAHAWYLNKELSGVDDVTKTKIQDVLKNDTLSRDQKITTAYDILEEDLKKNGKAATWDNIAKDKKEIDDSFHNTAASKDEGDNKKIISKCNDPKSFFNCVNAPSSKRITHTDKFYEELNSTELGTKIDFKKLSSYEGSASKAGYVPWGKTVSGGDPPNNVSGVTIATGFDLGGRDEQSLKKLGLSEALRTKLKPYLGLKKQDACNYLAKNPLELTEDEVNEIDKAVKQNFAKAIKSAWDGLKDAEKGKSFVDLEPEQQTVLFSRAFQEGTGWTGKSGYTDFLNAAKVGDWEAAKTAYDSVPLAKNASYASRFADESKLLAAANERLAAAQKAAEAAKAPPSDK